MLKNPSKVIGLAVGGFLASVIFLFVTLGLNSNAPSSSTRYVVALFCLTGFASLAVWGFASFVLWDATRKGKAKA
jgi:hypothetical protein